MLMKSLGSIVPSPYSLHPVTGWRRLTGDNPCPLNFTFKTVAVTSVTA